MKVRAIACALTGVCAAVAVAGCGSSSSGGSATASSSGGGGSGQPFRVFFDGDTTGPAKAYGAQQLEGLRAAAAYLNANGGIVGHKVTIDTASDNGDPAIAVSNMLKYLASHPKPDFAFTGATATSVSALIPVVAKRGILSAATNDGTNQCATGSQKMCPTFFTVNPPPLVVQSSVAAYAKKLGIAKLGILEQNQPFTQSETAPVKQALAKLGIQTEVVQFPSTVTDLTSQVDQLKSAGVDGIYAETEGPPEGYVATARAKLGWDVPLIFDLASSSLDITKLAPASQLKNAFEVMYRSDDPSQKLAGVTALTKSPGVGGAIPLNVAGIGWDDLIAVAAAAKVANSIDAKQIIAALEQKGVSDPNLTQADELRLTPDMHENQRETIADYPLLPVGPVRDGFVQAPAAG